MACVLERVSARGSLPLRLLLPLHLLPLPLPGKWPPSNHFHTFHNWYIILIFYFLILIFFFTFFVLIFSFFDVLLLFSFLTTSTAVSPRNTARSKKNSSGSNTARSMQDTADSEEEEEEEEGNGYGLVSTLPFHTCIHWILWMFWICGFLSWYEKGFFNLWVIHSNLVP